MSPVSTILLKRHAAGKRTWKLAGIEGVQKLAMIVGVDADRRGVVVVKRPADVVVTTQVVDPGRVFWQTKAMLAVSAVNNDVLRVASDSHSSAISVGL